MSMTYLVGTWADLLIIPIGKPEPRIKAIAFGLQGEQIPQVILRHRAKLLPGRRRFRAELVVLFVELVERKVRRQQCVDEVEEVVVVRDHSALDFLVEIGAEFISERGAMKEALLRFGGLRTGAARRATLLSLSLIHI